MTGAEIRNIMQESFDDFDDFQPPRTYARLEMHSDVQRNIREVYERNAWKRHDSY